MDYTFHYQVRRVQCLKNAIYRIVSQNERLFLSASFTAKIWVGSVLTLEKIFLRGFILKPTERA